MYKVKLNNPQMGTETLINLFNEVEGMEPVKLNNPQMGTETAFLMCFELLRFLPAC